MVLEALSPVPGERILDVGCGTGALAGMLAERFDGLVIGVDPAAGMIRRAADKAVLGCLFAVSYAEALPFPDGCFDAAVSAVSAHHWADAAGGFAELARVVRPGGRVIVADVGSLGPVVGLMKRFRRVDPHHHPGWHLQELGALLQRAGFRSVRARSYRIMGGRVVMVRARR